MMNMASAGRIAGLEPTLAPLLRDMRKPVVFHSPSPPAFENVAALARLGAPYASMRGATLGLAASARYGAFRSVRAICQHQGRRPRVLTRRFAGPVALLLAG